MSLKARALRLLVFLRVVDEHDGLISLTNVFLLVAVVKFARLKNVDLGDLTTFTLAMGAYAWKQHGRRTGVATEERIAGIEQAVSTASGTVATAVQALGEVKNKVAVIENRTAAGRMGK